jgi:hypothetical protein
MKSPVELLCSFLDSVERLHCGSVSGLKRDKSTLELRYKHEGFGFLSVALPSLCDALDRGLTEGRFACPTSFKKRGALPRFLSGLLCKVFEPLTGLLLESPDASVIKSLREILRFYKKTVVCSSREKKLDREAKQSFYQCDLEISEVYPQYRVNMLMHVCKFLLPNLDSEWDQLLFKHGPGSTKETSYSNQKWKELWESLRTEDTLTRLFDIDYAFCEEGMTGSKPSESHLSFSEILFSSDLANGVVPLYPRSTCAKLVSVAKNSTSRRTITVEPVANMYLQQALNTKLRDHIEKDSILSRCLALTDQSKNQFLAEVGSRTQQYATLDLSSASDRLALRLVELCFRDKPGFLTRAFACRTSHVDCGFATIQLKKFAGMGNALTFPIQSIVFAILSLCAMAEQDGVMPSYKRVKAYAARIRVYGDDIIVPTGYYASTTSWLTSFGLKVNQNKSFSEGNFRESCGTDWWNGVDVTPIYLRSWPEDRKTATKIAASLVSTSNQLWLKGLYEPSNLIRKYVESLLGSLPLVSKTSSVLGWVSRIDSQNAHVWCARLQSLMTKGYVVTSRRRRDSIDGLPGLFGSLSELEARGSNPDSQETPRNWETSVHRFHTRLRWRRMPTRLA